MGLKSHSVGVESTADARDTHLVGIGVNSNALRNPSFFYTNVHQMVFIIIFKLYFNLEMFGKAFELFR